MGGRTSRTSPSEDDRHADSSQDGDFRLGCRVLTWSEPCNWIEARPNLSAKDFVAGVGSDAGFSLVELMVALLIMAILLAIAIPTFLGTTASADDRSAQSNLVTAFTTAKAQYQNAGQTYTTDASTLATALHHNQPELQFIGLSSSGSLSEISVSVSSNGTGVVLAAYSVPGNCFYIVDNTAALTPADLASHPYFGTQTVSTSSLPVLGTIGLPTAVGTYYVGVSGDTDKSDCNANSPKASGAGAKARYQTAGFPS